MQTADAMVFQGVVGSVANLKTEAAKDNITKGWTYKANAEIKLTDADSSVKIDWANDEDQVIRIGDLLIADGTETNGVLTNNVTWKHIPSGYVADYNPKMTLITEAPNSATINLKSGVDSPLGSVAVAAAENSSVTVAAEGTQLTIGMAWGQF